MYVCVCMYVLAFIRQVQDLRS